MLIFPDGIQYILRHQAHQWSLSFALYTMLSVLILFALLCTSHAQWSTHTGDRHAAVHLFEWKWTDIAAECERFLAPYGYGAVQVSPPNEHRVVWDPWRPWWERYQPVSYQLVSRSGSEEEFTEMVERCNRVGVRIYVDAVINHMCGDVGEGYGIAGSYFDTHAQYFPEVPYSYLDFNSKEKCGTSSWNIESYQDVNQVRNCRLVSLLDLDQSKEWVQARITEYLNYLTSLGVAGFRIDAAKHMWPEDLEVIFSRLNNLPSNWFGDGKRPYIFHEVIDQGGEPITKWDYTDLGVVTEFMYGLKLGEVFRKWNGQKLAYLQNFGEDWGFLPGPNAWVFTDNHDNQRGHGGGGGSIITFWEPRLYKIANAFMLAWPYGFAKVMSSYEWHPREDDTIGPPSDENGNTNSVPINPDGTCDGGWVCEHRWRQIRNMVGFRNAVAGTQVENWWDNGNNQIAFSRGNLGFLAINNEDYDTMSRSFDTGLSTGEYCDVISGDLVDNYCTGKTIYVNGFGQAEISINSADEDPVVAIHVNSKIEGGGQESTTTTNPSLDYQRTVVFIKYESEYGEHLFLSGGIDHNIRPGCTDTASTSACAIAIQHIADVDVSFSEYHAWKQGDNYLDWYGAEHGQGDYYGQEAVGTPLAWSTNDPSNPGYQLLNKWGDHYWIADVNMDCSSSENGWFELKSIVLVDGKLTWENNISQVSSCSGTAGGFKPYSSGNHFARCGKLNVFQINSNSCQIDEIE